LWAMAERIIGARWVELAERLKRKKQATRAAAVVIVVGERVPEIC
jgi:hypothetical protein